MSRGACLVTLASSWIAMLHAQAQCWAVCDQVHRSKCLEREERRFLARLAHVEYIISWQRVSFGLIDGFSTSKKALVSFILLCTYKGRVGSSPSTQMPVFNSRGPHKTELKFSYEQLRVDGCYRQKIAIKNKDCYQKWRLLSKRKKPFIKLLETDLRLSDLSKSNLTWIGAWNVIAGSHNFW